MENELTITELCLNYGILYYEEDVMPFAWSEQWFTYAPIICDDDVVDTEIVIDINAINDTMDRLRMPILVRKGDGKSTVIATDTLQVY